MQLRAFDHPRAHRIEFDVAITGQQIVLGIHQTGFVASLPERAGATVAGIERAHVAASQHLHEARYAAGFGWRHEQVHVVVHQHIRMQFAARSKQRLPQELKIAESIAVVQEAGQAIVAALHDVLGNAGEFESGKAGHGASIPREPATEHRRVPPMTLGVATIPMWEK